MAILFWTGQVILVAAALLGAIKPFRELWNPPNPLVGKVNTVDFALPEPLVTALYDIVSLGPADVEIAFQKLPNQAAATAALSGIHDSLVARMKERMREQLDADQRFPPTKLTAINVRNRGDRKLTGVRLKVEAFGVASPAYVRLKREGSDPTYKLTTGVLDLGDLNPREELGILLWGFFAGRAWLTDEPTLIHSEGVGVVTWWEPHRSAAQVIVEAYRPSTSGVLLVVLAAVTSWILWRRRHQAMGKSANRK